MTGFVRPDRVQGMDGKVYPSRPLHPDDRDFLIGRCHFLAHDERLSVRQIVARLHADHGVHRSIGTVHTWLNSWRCDHCSGGNMFPPEQVPGAGPAVQVTTSGAPEQPAGVSA